MLLQQESVRKFIELVASALGWNKNNTKGIIWEGEGIDEIGIRADTGQVVIRIDKRYFRLCEVDTLLGDATKAANELGWEATTSLEVIEEMIKEDLEIAQKEVLFSHKGFQINTPKEKSPGQINNL